MNISPFVLYIGQELRLQGEIAIVQEMGPDRWRLGCCDVARQGDSFVITNVYSLLSPQRASTLGELKQAILVLERSMSC